MLLTLLLVEQERAISKIEILNSATDRKEKERYFPFLADEKSLQTLRASSGVLKFGLNKVRARIDDEQE